MLPAETLYRIFGGNLEKSRHCVAEIVVVGGII